MIHEIPLPQKQECLRIALPNDRVRKSFHVSRDGHLSLKLEILDHATGKILHADVSYNAAVIECRRENFGRVILEKYLELRVELLRQIVEMPVFEAQPASPDGCPAVL